MDRIVYAIDPGTEESAFVAVRFGGETASPYCGVLEHAKLPNDMILDEIVGIARQWGLDGTHIHLVIEEIASYGMRVGREVFETVFWSGRFYEAALSNGFTLHSAHRLSRRQVKLEICGRSNANDADIRQAVIDIFGASRQQAIGTKKAPGPLYGVKRDCWQAIALAIAWERATRRKIECESLP